LESIVCQADFVCGADVDILVSDNASTDQTTTVVAEYQSRYPGRITLNKNAENLGYDRNVDAVLRSADGEWVLLLSDDDALERGALRVVLDALGSGQTFAVLFTGARLCHFEEEDTQPDNPKDANDCVLFAPGLNYLKKRRTFPPYLLSGYVIRKDDWARVAVDDLFGTGWIHVLASLRLLINHPVCVSSAYVVRYRGGNGREPQWVDGYPFRFTLYLRLLVGCHDVEAVDRRLARHLLRQVLREIANHILERKVTRSRFDGRRLWRTLREQVEAGEPLLWINGMLLACPAWLLPVPFKVAKKCVAWLHERQRDR
jgi:glycosyltransferase involved in cell wall biosynthesis